MSEKLFENRVPEAAARQVAIVLVTAVEEHFATLESMRYRKGTPKGDIARQERLCRVLVAQCLDIGVTTLGLRGARCSRLEAELAALDWERSPVDGGQPDDTPTSDQPSPSTDAVRQQPRLRVVVASFPETNGKRNWTALILREDHSWGGLVGTAGGVTLARGEMWNRVAYEAERAKYLIGLRDTEPFVLDYGDDTPTPDGWGGEKGPRRRNGRESVVGATPRARDGSQTRG